MARSIHAGAGFLFFMLLLDDGLSLSDLACQDPSKTILATREAGARKTHKDTDNFACHGRRYPG